MPLPVIVRSPPHDILPNKLVALNDIQLIEFTVMLLVLVNVACFSASELSMDVLV